MTTLNRRAFCKKLHGIVKWQSYDTYAEYAAVELSRELLSGANIETFVAKHSQWLVAKAPLQIEELKALLACQIDETFPLKEWRFGRLQR